MADARVDYRTTTRPSASRGRRPRPTSRRPSASWPANPPGQASPATRPPSGGSRRSTRPTRSSRTRASGASTTSSARTGRPTRGPARGGGAGRDPFGPGSPFAGFARARRRRRAAARARRRPVRVSIGRRGRRRRVLGLLPHDVRRRVRPAAGEPERFDGRPRANPSTSSSPGSGMAGAARAPGTADAARRRRTSRAAVEVTRRDHPRGGVPRHEPPRRGRGRRLEVTIPRGVATGSRVRLTGKGPGGRRPRTS